jgi:hypothetical protein
MKNRLEPYISCRTQLVSHFGLNWPVRSDRYFVSVCSFNYIVLDMTILPLLGGHIFETIKGSLALFQALTIFEGSQFEEY